MTLLMFSHVNFICIPLKRYLVALGINTYLSLELWTGILF